MKRLLNRVLGWLKDFWTGVKVAVDGRDAVDSGSRDSTNQNR